MYNIRTQAPKATTSPLKTRTRVTSDYCSRYTVAWRVSPGARGGWVYGADTWRQTGNTRTHRAAAAARTYPPGRPVALVRHSR